MGWSVKRKHASYQMGNWPRDGRFKLKRGIGLETESVGLRNGRGSPSHDAKTRRAEKGDVKKVTGARLRITAGWRPSASLQPVTCHLIPLPRPLLPGAGRGDHRNRAKARRGIV